jgi:hypothetical protein
MATGPEGLDALLDSLMTPVRIEFVSLPHWRLVWLATLVICLGLLGVTIWRSQQVRGLDQTQRDRIFALQQLGEKDSRRPPINIANPRRANVQRVHGLLQHDPNKLFATIENLQVPGVVLHAVTFDTAANMLRLEFDLNSLEKSSTVTLMLNAGHDDAPWRMEKIIRGVETNPSTPASSMATYQGTWIAQVARY